MLNTSIKVIATQHTDDHDGVKFEKTKSTVNTYLSPIIS